MKSKLIILGVVLIVIFSGVYIATRNNEVLVGGGTGFGGTGFSGTNASTASSIAVTDSPSASVYEYLTWVSTASGNQTLQTASSTLVYKPSTVSFGIGTSTPLTLLQVTATSTNATSTITIGKVGQSKGSCLELFNTAGTASYVYVVGTTLTVSASSCK